MFYKKWVEFVKKCQNNKKMSRICKEWVKFVENVSNLLKKS